MSIETAWSPKPGDRIKRTSTVFGEALDTVLVPDSFEILIIRKESSVDGYWTATTAEGESRILTTEELIKTTCEWVPWPHQIIEYAAAELGCSLQYVLRELSNLAVYKRELTFEELCHDFLLRVEAELRRKEAEFSRAEEPEPDLSSPGHVCD